MNTDTVIPVAPAVAPPPGGLASHEHDAAIFEAIWPSSYADQHDPVQWYIACDGVNIARRDTLADAELFALDGPCEHTHRITLVKLGDPACLADIGHNAAVPS